MNNMKLLVCLMICLFLGLAHAADKIPAHSSKGQAQSEKLLIIFNNIDFVNVSLGATRSINYISNNFDIENPDVSSFMIRAMNRLPYPMGMIECEPEERFNIAGSVMAAIIKIKPIAGVSWLFNNIKHFNNPIGITHVFRATAFLPSEEKYKLLSMYLDDKRIVPDGYDDRVCDKAYQSFSKIKKDFKSDLSKFPGKSELIAQTKHCTVPELLPPMFAETSIEERDELVGRLKKWCDNHLDEATHGLKSYGFENEIEKIRAQIIEMNSHDLLNK